MPTLTNAFHLLFLIAVDHEDGLQSAKQCNMQDELMTAFFQEIASRFLRQISHRDTDGDVCGDTGGLPWQGIQCTSGAVRKVHYPYSPYGNFHLEFLPPTVQSIDISSSGQNYAVRTRFLPREIQSLKMSNQRIHRKVDFTTLPENIVAMQFQRNFIRGPIDFTRLPHKLEYVDLSCNRITQGVLYYSNLPVTLNVIVLTYEGCQNRIGTVLPLNAEDGVSGLAYFRYLPANSM